jgi:hypothetical protein
MKKKPKLKKTKKQKSYLLSLTSEDDNAKAVKPYLVTTDECEVWFDIVNKEIFGNTLKPVDKINIKKSVKSNKVSRHAYYLCTFGDDDQIKETSIHMKNKYKSEKFFVEVLAHEMVHHYQILNDEPVGHGPTFTKWVEAFNKKGLQLSKAM